MNWLRRWLYKDIADHIDELTLHIMRLEDELASLREDLVRPLNSVAVILSDEHSKTRKRLSDRIADQAIAKLKGEDLARRHTLGEIE